MCMVFVQQNPGPNVNSVQIINLSTVEAELPCSASQTLDRVSHNLLLFGQRVWVDLQVGRCCVMALLVNLGGVCLREGDIKGEGRTKVDRN